jgi:hypothetical protein
VQAKARSEADSLRKDNDALRLEAGRLERKFADLSEQLKSSQAGHND